MVRTYHTCKQVHAYANRTYVHKALALLLVHKKMDYSRYIPVLCQTEGTFRGKCYWEKISSVVGHKGISFDRPLTKSDFVEGDEVVIRFRGRDYTGVVKSNEGAITTRSPSPSQTTPGPTTVEESEGAQAGSRPGAETGETHHPAQVTDLPSTSMIVAAVSASNIPTPTKSSIIHSRTPTKRRRGTTKKKGQLRTHTL